MRFSDWSSDVCSSDLFPGRDRTEKIVDLPFGNILLPALDHARGAVLHEDRIPEMGVVDELLPVRGRHRDHETFDVSHGEVPSSVEMQGFIQPPCTWLMRMLRRRARAARLLRIERASGGERGGR